MVDLIGPADRGDDRRAHRTGRNNDSTSARAGGPSGGPPAGRPELTTWTVRGADAAAPDRKTQRKAAVRPACLPLWRWRERYEYATVATPSLARPPIHRRSIDASGHTADEAQQTAGARRRIAHPIPSVFRLVVFLPRAPPHEWAWIDLGYRSPAGQGRAELGHAHTVMLDPSIWTMVIVYPDRASCWTLDRPASSSGVRLCARADRAADLEALVRAVRPQLAIEQHTPAHNSSDMRTLACFLCWLQQWHLRMQSRHNVHL